MSVVGEERIRAAFMPAREMIESDDAVSAALAASGGAGRIRSRWLLLGLILAVLVPASAVAINAIRGEPGTAGDSFTNYLDGVAPETHPGLPLSSGSDGGLRGTRSFLLENGVDFRVLARNGPAAIYMARSEDGQRLMFDLTGVVGLSFARRGLFRNIADRPLLTLAIGASQAKRLEPLRRRGLIPVYGLATQRVDRVRVKYASGSFSEEVKADGGFIALADPRREPELIQGLDETGRVIGRVPAGAGWDEATRVLRRG